MNTKIDFLYLNQDYMVKAGVTDMHHCIEVMCEMFDLLGKGDYLMGGNNPKMLGIALFDQFNKYLNRERAAALSVIMFLICAVSAAVYIYTNLKENEWEKK